MTTHPSSADAALEQIKTAIIQLQTEGLKAGEIDAKIAEEFGVSKKAAAGHRKALATESQTDTPEPRRQKAPPAEADQDQTAKPFNLSIDKAVGTLAAVRPRGTRKRADDGVDVADIEIALELNVADQVGSMPYAKSLAAWAEEQENVGSKATTDHVISRNFGPIEAVLRDPLLKLEVAVQATVKGKLKITQKGDEKTRLKLALEGYVPLDLVTDLLRLQGRELGVSFSPAQQELF